MVKIIVIDEKSPYLKKVMELGQTHSSTLGFFPKGAFIQHAAQKQILVALDGEENVLGYLLYATSHKKMLAYIAHLCVERSYRRKGIAKALFDELKRLTKDTFRGIRVHCRLDYDANALWPKLGFVAVSEMPGRSRQGTTLIKWWFDHGHPTLFTFADEQRTQSKLKIAIDANIFYELAESPTSSNEESHALLADWLTENVELCLTPEILNEIIRNENEAERKRKRALANMFPMLSGPDDEFQKIKEELRGLFLQQTTESDVSDLHQLARAIAAGVQFFVTRDNPLLKKDEQIYERFGMRVIRPSDLIIQQDALMREAEYQPARLAGSHIKIERIQSRQSSFLEDTFRTPQDETKVEFRQRLQPCLTDPHVFETHIVRDVEHPLALIIYGRWDQLELEIPLFRVLQISLSATLARYLVLHAILVSSSEERIITKITDPHLSDEVVDALQENGFVFVSNVWIKVNLPIVETAEELNSRLTSLGNDFPQLNQYFNEIGNLLKVAHSTNNIQTLLKAERSLWPAKIIDIEIPAFVVSIPSVPIIVRQLCPRN